MNLLETLQDLLEKGATAEEIQSSLGKFMIPKGQFNKVNEENTELKQRIANFDLEKIKLEEKIDELKTANMSEQELLKHELEKAQKLIANNAIEKNRLTAENKFVSAGFEKEQYEPLLEQIVSEDVEKTNALVDGFITLADNKAKESVDNKVNELLEKNSILPNGDKGGDGEITVEQFKSYTVGERTKLFNENRDLYNKLQNELNG